MPKRRHGSSSTCQLRGSGPARGTESNRTHEGIQHPQPMRAARRPCDSPKTLQCTSLGLKRPCGALPAPDPASVGVPQARFSPCSGVRGVKPCVWMKPSLALREIFLTFQDMHVVDARHRAYHFVKVHRLPTRLRTSELPRPPALVGGALLKRGLAQLFLLLRLLNLGSPDLLVASFERSWPGEQG
jgi:hypothetical protein